MKKQKTALAIFLAAVLLVTMYPIVSIASDIYQAESQKTELEKKKQETEKKIKQLEKEKGNIISYIQKLDQQLNDINDELEKLEKRISVVQEDIAAAKSDLAAARIKENNQYVTMKRRIKYMYENGSADYMDILFTSDSISDLLNRTEYISKISEYDNQLLERHQKTKTDIGEQEKELEGQLEQLTMLNDEAAYEKSTVEKLAQDKSDELEKSKMNIADSKDMAQQYSTAIAAQEKQIEDLLEQERQRIEEQRRKEEEKKRKEEEERRKQEQNGQTEPGQSQPGDQDNNGPDTGDHEGGSSDFRWPLNVKGVITSRFGGRESPTEGASSNHKGVDIGVPSGTEVLAAASGTVVTSSYQAAAGNYIMIYHGDSTYTVYMHCSKLAVSVDQKVTKGQVIAYSGSTGVSTGPHLHFGVSKGGSYVNPLDYVSY